MPRSHRLMTCSLPLAIAVSGALLVGAGPATAGQGVPAGPGVVDEDGLLSYVTVVSDNGFLGGGAAYTLLDDDYDVHLDDRFRDLDVHVGPSSPMHLSITLPGERELTTGTWVDDDTYPEGPLEETSPRTAEIQLGAFGRGCDETGEVTLHDYAADLSRLHLSYQIGCGGPAYVSGEVVYRMPADPAGAQTVPSAVDWPAEHRGERGRLVPVTLVNTADAPLRVAGARISSGADDFRVAATTCEQLAPDEACVTHVRFTPSSYDDAPGTLVLDTDRGERTVALRGRVDPGTTVLRTRSEEGDWVGQGESYEFTADELVSAWGNDNAAELRFRGEDGWLSASFSPDPDRLLLPGTTFTDVGRYGFQDAGQAGMSVTGNGRGCNDLRGRFTVHEAGYLASGALSHLVVEFVQHCESADAALRGVLAWHAREEVPQVPGRDREPPAPLSGLGAQAATDAMVLRWGPLAERLARVEVWARPGTTPPTEPGDGTLVYSGLDEGATVSRLAPHPAWSVSAFAVDWSGNASAPTSQVVRSTRLELRADDRVVPRPERVKLRGRLRPQADGLPPKAIGNQRVWLQERPRGSSEWRTLGEALMANPRGLVRKGVVVRRTTRYRVVFTGDGTWFGDRSPVVKVRVKRS